MGFQSEAVATFSLQISKKYLICYEECLRNFGELLNYLTEVHEMNFMPILWLVGWGKGGFRLNLRFRWGKPTR